MIETGRIEARMDRIIELLRAASLDGRPVKVLDVDLDSYPDEQIDALLMAETDPEPVCCLSGRTITTEYVESTRDRMTLTASFDMSAMLDEGERPTALFERMHAWLRLALRADVNLGGMAMKVTVGAMELGHMFSSRRVTMSGDIAVVFHG